MSENGVYPIYSKLQAKGPAFTHSSFNPAQRNFVFTQAPPKFAHTASSLAFNVNRTNKWLLWHHRLGHPNDNVLYSAISNLEPSNVFKFNSAVVTHCKHCLGGKMHHLPFVKSGIQSKAPLELIHADVWDPAPIVPVNDFRYYLVLVDDFTKFCLGILAQTQV